MKKVENAKHILIEKHVKIKESKGPDAATSIDTDELSQLVNHIKIITKLNIGNSYIKHIPDKKIKGILKKSFIATSDWMQISEVDVIIMCLPTPLKNDNVPNLQYILETLLMIKPYLKKGQLLVLESTTYPGTTEEELVPFAEQCGFNIGENFFQIVANK